MAGRVDGKSDFNEKQLDSLYLDFDLVNIKVWGKVCIKEANFLRGNSVQQLNNTLKERTHMLVVYNTTREGIESVRF